MIPLTEARKTCLDHLHVCKAACCRTFRFRITSRVQLRRGMTPTFVAGNMDDDLKWYYELHGCKVEGNRVSLTLKDFKQIGTLVIINETCRALTPDNLCGLHPDKPLVCQLQTWDNPRPSGIYTPPDCMFREAR